jgi:hypothetical protein
MDLFSYTPPGYPTHPGFKEQDTSRKAASRTATRVEGLRAQIIVKLRAAGETGLTADEAAEQMGETSFSIRPRFTELVRFGKIKDSGLRRRNESGSTAKVWVIA